MKVLPPALYEKLKRSIRSNGSIAPVWMLDIESAREDFEESGTGPKRSAGKPSTPATRQGKPRKQWQVRIPAKMTGVSG